MKPKELAEMIEKAKTKKISLNINETVLQMIDELAKIHTINRTQMLEALISSGLKFQSDYSENYWKTNLSNKDFSGDKEIIKNKIEEIKSFKKKWQVDKALEF